MTPEPDEVSPVTAADTIVLAQRFPTYEEGGGTWTHVVWPPYTLGDSEIVLVRTGSSSTDVSLITETRSAQVIEV